MNLSLHRLGFTILFFLGALQAHPQQINILNPDDIAIGDWRAHFPFLKGVSVTEADDRIYCATNLSLYYYSPSDNSIGFLSKVDGLSDIGVSTINYNPYNEVLLIAYENTNIDLVIGNQIINISDIKRKNIVGEKKINKIFFIDDLAYLACSFGIVVIDLEKFEIKDTYHIGNNGASIRVNAVTASNDSLFAATEEGIKVGDLNNPNLANFNFWFQHDSNQQIPAGAVKNIASLNNVVYADISDTVYYYKNGKWNLLFTDTGFTVLNIGNSYNKVFVSQYKLDGLISDRQVTTIGANNAMEVLKFQFVAYPSETIQDFNGTVWIADLSRGLVKYDQGSEEIIRPNGPSGPDISEMLIENSQLWVAGGGVNASWNNLFNTIGFFSYAGNHWQTYDKYNNPELDTLYDVLNIAIHPTTDHVFFGTFIGGIFEFYEGDIINIYKQNSSLQGTSGNEEAYRVDGLAFDDNGNLWATNFKTGFPISVMKTDGTWKAFKPSINLGFRFLGPILVDSHDQKWIVSPKGGGLIVFNHGASIDDTSDDQYLLLERGEGKGNLPSVSIFCIEEDLNGDIWIGTNEGIAVIYCPGQMFDQQNFCDAQQILVTQDDYTGFLMETETVFSIAVDGANRKWIGTGSGVWLMSEDGTEEIAHFTEENSPLLSNNIVDIVVDDITGEVYFGTQKGIISYKSTATIGGTECDDIVVFPNPVYETYNGLIAINGLVQNASVKITDISGNLIYQTTALGGQTVWNGFDYSGNRAKTGVYLVFASNTDGSETCVGKFLILR